MRMGWGLVAALGACLALSACRGDEALTQDDVNAALEEIGRSTQVQAITADMVEISTHFTVGGALEDGAEELRLWIASQVPCADISRDGATVTIDFGDLQDTCVYNGRTYGGVAAVTLGGAADGTVAVHHVWTDLTNGHVTLSGKADVTWDLNQATRTVDHEILWLIGDESVTGEGHRVQALMDDAEGIVIDGTRGWTSVRGRWDLAIESVEVRWQDPLPQAGRYVLTNPASKTLTLDFVRTGPLSIVVTVSGPRRSFQVTVATLP